MIPTPFAYHRALSVTDAEAALREGGEDAKVLAGGMSLIPIMKTRLAGPRLLVDIGDLSELRYVRPDEDVVRIGALTRHADLVSDPVVREKLPLLAAVAAEVGDAQVRARGTIGGVMAHADSAGDYCAVALMLDAQIVTTRRRISAIEFFVDFMTTPLEADELITEIVIPAQTGARDYVKFRRRRSDWAIIGVGVQATPQGYRIGLTNVASTAVRALAGEKALADGASPAEAAIATADSVTPRADAGGSVDYKKALVKVLTERALLKVGAA